MDNADKTPINKEIKDSFFLVMYKIINPTEKKNRERLKFKKVTPVKTNPKEKTSFTGLILLMSFDIMFAAKRSENAIINFCGFKNCPWLNKIIQSGKDNKCDEPNLKLNLLASEKEIITINKIIFKLRINASTKISS